MLILQKDLISQMDQTKNFVFKNENGQIFEARYVRRNEDYFICYLSTHSGCVKGCGFCHLTRSGQTSFSHASLDDFARMSDEVFRHYSSQPKAKTVHYDFMVRGEPLANRNIIGDGFSVLLMLATKAREHGLAPKFNVSTIMPVEVKNKRLAEIFSGIYPSIYYSLYSLDETFRKKWVPQAMNPFKALDILSEYQKDSLKILVVHGCVISGENDDEEGWKKILAELDQRNIKAKFNLVKYNPYGAISPGGIGESGLWGEAVGDDKMEKIARILSEYGPSKVVSRVGFDVKASCGMFVDGCG